MSVLFCREGQRPHQQYIYSPPCFQSLPPQDSSTSSVSGASLKTGSGPGAEQETATLYWDDHPLSLLPFSGCRCPEGARLSEPSSQLCARQALLTAPLTLLVVAGNMVSCSLLIRSRPCPLLHQKSIIPVDGDEPRPGPLSFDHLRRPAEESNRRTSWWCWGPFSPEHSRWRW